VTSVSPSGTQQPHELIDATHALPSRRRSAVAPIRPGRGNGSACHSRQLGGVTICVALCVDAQTQFSMNLTPLSRANLT
jgi:hypothetical protein